MLKYCNVLFLAALNCCVEQLVKLRQPAPRALGKRRAPAVNHGPIEPLGPPSVPQRKGQIAEGKTQALAFYAICTQGVVGKRQGQLKGSKSLFRSAIFKKELSLQLKEGQLFAEMLQSPEFAEAATAFMERRKPDFSKFG